MFCSQCGTPNSPDRLFCTRCNAPLAASANPVDDSLPPWLRQLDQAPPAPTQAPTGLPDWMRASDAPAPTPPPPAPAAALPPWLQELNPQSPAPPPASQAPPSPPPAQPAQ